MGLGVISRHEERRSVSGDSVIASVIIGVDVDLRLVRCARAGGAASGGGDMLF